MDRDAARRAVINLTRQSAATWQRVSRETFPGETTIETTNTLYRFKDGVFFGRAPKTSASDAAAWESPPSMAGVELIGFLADEDGLWSLSPRWRPGSLAVLCRPGDRAAALDDGAFLLTSPTATCTIQRPGRAGASRGASAISRGGPLLVRRPAPLSMTRLQPRPAPR
jgi:hypothetical protein